MREYLFQRPIDLLAMERDAIHAIEFGGSWVKRMEWKGKERNGKNEETMARTTNERRRRRAVWFHQRSLHRCREREAKRCIPSDLQLIPTSRTTGGREDGGRS